MNLTHEDLDPIYHSLLIMDAAREAIRKHLHDLDLRIIDSNNQEEQDERSSR